MLDEVIRQVFRQRADLIEVLNEILGFDVGTMIADFRIVTREEVVMIVDEIIVCDGRRLVFRYIDGDKSNLSFQIYKYQ